MPDDIIGETNVDASEVFRDAVINVTVTRGWRFRVGLLLLRLAAHVLRSRVEITRSEGASDG